MKDLITEIEFNNDIEFDGDYENMASVQRFIEFHQDIDMSELQSAVDAFNAQSVEVSKDDMKEVYIMLKDRELHPKGEFDKQGRFYLDDSELVDCRNPSTKYPYPQMQAGRTSKFVKAIAEKYKCQSKADLISRFNGA